MCVFDRRRQLATEHGNRTRHHKARLRAENANALEKCPGGIEVDSHAKFELLLSLAGDDCGEMKDGTGVCVNKLFDLRGVGNVAGENANAGIVDAFERVNVKRLDL